MDNKQITTEQLERVLKAVNELVKERPIATESEVTIEPAQPATPDEQAPPPPGLAPLSAAEQEQLLQVIESRCVKCHSPEDKSGGWDLTQYASYSQQQKYQVVQSLTGKGPKGKAMPLNEEPLSEQESMLLLRDYVSGNQ